MGVLEANFSTEGVVPVFRDRRPSGAPPAKAAGQGRLVRFLAEVRDHVLASVATCAASPSASSASGSKSSPIHSVNSAWRSCFGSDGFEKLGIAPGAAAVFRRAASAHLD